MMPSTAPATPTFQQLPPPTDGEAITVKRRQAHRPRRTDQFPSSKVTAPAPTSGVRRSTCSMARCESPMAGPATTRLVRGIRRREIEGPIRLLAAGRHAGGDSALSRRDQGSADDAGGRRIPLAQRGAPPAARSVCLRPAGALVHRRALAGEGSRCSGHGDLPREHRGHLRRDRIRGLQRRRQAS